MRPPMEGAAALHLFSLSGRESLMRSWRVMCCAVGLVVAAAGLQAVVKAVAQESGLLEKRESLYNNIFIFGDKDTVTMTFGQNKRYYTESSMKLSDPGALTV